MQIHGYIRCPDNIDIRTNPNLHTTIFFHPSGLNG